MSFRSHLDDAYPFPRPPITSGYFYASEMEGSVTVDSPLELRRQDRESALLACRSRIRNYSLPSQVHVQPQTAFRPAPRAAVPTDMDDYSSASPTSLNSVSFLSYTPPTSPCPSPAMEFNELILAQFRDSPADLPEDVSNDWDVDWDVDISLSPLVAPAGSPCSSRCLSPIFDLDQASLTHRTLGRSRDRIQAAPYPMWSQEPSRGIDRIMEQKPQGRSRATKSGSVDN
ncbi:hypothetical protein B0H12DRAFT_1231007 [Mycena haematopus]|nr:hypothetical protein B0H12DRAFT_1231007 [Mycena haematopus]